jgi:hypothetical protein
MNGRTTARDASVKRLRFSSLREAQAIWRVMHGEDVCLVSQSLDVPLATLVPWHERVKQEKDPAIPPRPRNEELEEVSKDHPAVLFA